MSDGLPDRPAPGTPRVKLVRSGKAPWSRKKKAFLSGCGCFVFAILGICIWSGVAARKAWKVDIVPGERFYPEDPVAPDNLLVARADLSDPGFAEHASIVLNATQGDDTQLPESVRWLKDMNKQNTAAGLGIYLPITITTSWDDPVAAVTTGSSGVAVVASAGVASVTTTSGPEPRKLVVVQYRGLTSLICKAMSVFVEKAAHETFEHRGTTFGAGASPGASDPDEKRLMAIDDRMIIANRVSLAKGTLDAAASPPETRPASDPRRLWDLLPAERQVAGLHRGRSAALVIDTFLEHRREVARAYAEDMTADPKTPLPDTPFDKSALETVAWSLTFKPIDEARLDVVLRFKTEEAAADAAKNLNDPAGPHWTWLADVHVPAQTKMVERPDPLTVHLVADGPGAGPALRATLEDSRQVDRIARRRMIKVWQGANRAIEDAKKRSPAKPTAAPTPK